jgi:ABC-type methionine transport system permease subunit
VDGSVVGGMKLKLGVKATEKFSESQKELSYLSASQRELPPNQKGIYSVPFVILIILTFPFTKHIDITMSRKVKMK